MLIKFMEQMTDSGAGSQGSTPPASGATPASNQGTGFSAGTDLSAQLKAGSTTTPPATSEFSIPESYKDKSYAKNIKSMDELWKQFDGAQQLIGKKTVGIPTQDSPPEEWDQFFNKMGRPEAFDKYDLGELKGDPEVEKSIKEIFYKNGLNQKQAKEIVESYTGVLKSKAEAMQKAEQDKQAKLDQEFEELSGKLFGDKKDQVFERSKKMLLEMAPAEMRQHLDKLNNHQLITLSSILNNVHEKYMTEDSVPNADRTGGQAVDFRQEAQNIMNSEAYKNPFHRDHDATVAKVNELYKRIK